MAKVLGNKGPHRVLVQEDTLDYILSFVHGWNDNNEIFLPSARLVCQKWNERILAKFHKRLSFTFVKFNEKMREGPAFLTSCDPRILSSVSLKVMCKPYEYAGWMMESVIELLRLSGRIKWLRILRLAILDERMLDYLIQVANQGNFVGLEEFQLRVTFNNGKDQHKCEDLVDSGAFSGLRSLNVTISIGSRCPNKVARLNSENLPTAIQSLVTAAPGLRSLITNVFLDLSGTRLRRLDISDRAMIESDKEIKMLDSVKDWLTNLQLAGPCHNIQFPLMPNLVSLDSDGYKDSCKISLKAMPALSRMKIHPNAMNWGQLPILLPPLGQLRKLELESSHWDKTEDLATLVEPFRILMNSGLSLLSLFFKGSKWPRISQLRELLELVDMDKSDERNERNKGVLEFYFVKDDTEGCNLEDFAFFLEKLGRHWSHVLFHCFKFQVKQNQEVIKVPLFEGKKNGKIQMNACKKDSFCVDDGKTVSLEMID